jgi:TonB family protein
MLLVLCPALSIASLREPAFRYSDPSTSGEVKVWIATVRDSHFSPVPVFPLPNLVCGNSRVPEALMTPDPPLSQADAETEFSVSFIVGTDGRVHSLFLIESAGSTQDQAVLRTVASWRYRPAQCDGVPTEAEGRVEFSVR